MAHSSRGVSEDGRGPLYADRVVTSINIKDPTSSSSSNSSPISSSNSSTSRSRRNSSSGSSRNSTSSHGSSVRRLVNEVHAAELRIQRVNSMDMADWMAASLSAAAAAEEESRAAAAAKTAAIAKTAAAPPGSTCFGCCRVSRWWLLVLFCVHSLFIGPHYLNWAPLRQSLVHWGVYEWLCDTSSSSSSSSSSSGVNELGGISIAGLSLHNSIDPDDDGLYLKPSYLASSPSPSAAAAAAAPAAAPAAAAGGGGWQRLPAKCKEQEIAIARLFVVTTACDFGVSFLGGLLLDVLGPKVASLTGSLLMLAGWLIVSFSTSYLSLYLLGFAFYGLGIDAAFYGVLSLPVLFPNKESLVMSLLMGSRCLAWATPILLEHLISPFGLHVHPKTILLSVQCSCLFCGVLIAAFFIPLKPFKRDREGRETEKRRRLGFTSKRDRDNECYRYFHRRFLRGIKRRQRRQAEHEEQQQQLKLEIGDLQQQQQQQQQTAAAEVPTEAVTAAAAAAAAAADAATRVAARTQRGDPPAAAGTAAAAAAAAADEEEGALKRSPFSLASLEQQLFAAAARRPRAKSAAATATAAAAAGAGAGSAGAAAAAAAEAAAAGETEEDKKSGSRNLSRSLNTAPSLSALGSLGGPGGPPEPSLLRSGSDWQQGLAAAAAVCRTDSSAASAPPQQQHHQRHYRRRYSELQQQEQQLQQQQQDEDEEGQQQRQQQPLQHQLEIEDALTEEEREDGAFDPPSPSKLRRRPVSFLSCLSYLHASFLLKWRRETVPFIKEFICSSAFLSMLPYFSLTLLRGVYFGESSDYFVSECMRSLYILMGLVFIFPPLLGLVADKGGVGVCLLCVNTLGLLLMSLCIMQLYIHSKALAVIISLFFSAYAPLMSAQIYIYMLAAFPPKHIGKLLGLCMSFGGFVSLLGTPLFELSVHRNIFFVIILCFFIVLSFGGYGLIYWGVQAADRKIREEREKDFIAKSGAIQVS